MGFPEMEEKMKMTKQEMKEAAATSADEFVDAIKKGNLDYFIPIMEQDVMTSSEYLMAAKTTITWFIKEYNPEEPMKIFVRDLRPLYNVLCGKSENDYKFGKLMSRHGLVAKKMRVAGNTGRGVEVFWQLFDNDIKDLKEKYLKESPVPGYIDRIE